MPTTRDVSTYPSDYLHYWWEHYENGPSFLSSMYFRDKQTILAAQLKNIQARNRQLFSRVATQTNISKDSFSQLYETLRNNPKALSGDLDSFSLAQRGQEVGSLEEAIGVLNNQDSWLNELNTGAEYLYKAAQKITSPENVKLWGEAILDDYILNSVAKGSFSDGYTTENRTRAAAEIISNFRNKVLDRTLFDVPANLEARSNQLAGNLSRQEREILALIAAVGKAQGSAAIQSSVKSGWNNIATSWENQCRGLGSFAGSQTHRAASAAALINAVNKLSKEEDKVLNSLQSKTLPGKNIKVEERFIKNQTWENIKKRAGASLTSIQSKRGKSNVEMVFSANGVEVSFLRAVTRQSVSYYPPNPLAVKGHSGAYLALHQNGSFLNFLNREMGMSSNDLHGLIQLLVARSARTDLTGYWEKLKENVAYRGFLSALAGFTSGEQAQFMIIGDRIIAIEDLIRSAITGDVMPYATYSPNYSRSDFLAKSSWVGKIGPNQVAAIERSEIAWNTSSAMLNSMILNIKMDLTANFISNRLTN